MKLIRNILLLFSFLTYTQAGHAATISGLTGAYDAATWTKSNTISGTPVSSYNSSTGVLTIMEPNAGGGKQETQWSHVMGYNGTINFNWSFNAAIDPCCSGLDFWINGTEYVLANNGLTGPYAWSGSVLSGSFTHTYNAGDTIKFAAMTSDSCCGATTNTFSNITFEEPSRGTVPEPSTIAIMGLGLASMRYARRRKSAQA